MMLVIILKAMNSMSTIPLGLVFAINIMSASMLMIIPVLRLLASYLLI